jgi:hypothetical protein
MLKLCIEGLPGKIGRCITIGGPPKTIPPPPAHHVKQQDESREPGLYPEIITDLSIVDSIHSAAEGVTDEGTREALLSGIESAVKALQKRGGKDIASIAFEA